MPPIIPFIPALIGAGASIGSAILGRPGQEEKDVMTAQAEQAQLQTEAARKGIGFAEELQPLSMNLLRRGQGAMGGALDYWRRILSGRESATSVMGPQINQILNSYRQARISGRTLNPRGGGGSEFTRRLDEEVIPGQISGLLASARPMAAQQVGALGGDMSQLGFGGMGTASGLLNLGTGAGTGVLQYGLGRAQQQSDLGRDLGRNLLSLWPSGGGGAPFPGGTGTGGSIPPQFPPNPFPGPPQVPGRPPSFPRLPPPSLPSYLNV
jgi:hypothetical protein